MEHETERALRNRDTRFTLGRMIALDPEQYHAMKVGYVSMCRQITAGIDKRGKTEDQILQEFRRKEDGAFRKSSTLSLMRPVLEFVHDKFPRGTVFTMDKWEPYSYVWRDVGEITMLLFDEDALDGYHDYHALDKIATDDSIVCNLQLWSYTDEIGPYVLSWWNTFVVPGRIKHKDVIWIRMEDPAEGVKLLVRSSIDVVSGVMVSYFPWGMFDAYVHARDENGFTTFDHVLGWLRGPDKPEFCSVHDTYAEAKGDSLGVRDGPTEVFYTAVVSSTRNYLSYVPARNFISIEDVTTAANQLKNT